MKLSKSTQQREKVRAKPKKKTKKKSLMGGRMGTELCDHCPRPKKKKKEKKKKKTTLMSALEGKRKGGKEKRKRKEEEEKIEKGEKKSKGITVSCVDRRSEKERQRFSLQLSLRPAEKGRLRCWRKRRGTEGIDRKR